MIDLPHQEPLKFVKEIINKNENKVTISSSFPYNPTLSMAIEAAAQGTICFNNSNEENKIGFLVSLKNVSQLQAFNKKEYLIEIEKNYNFDNMIICNFKLINDSETYAIGELTIALAK